MSQLSVDNYDKMKQNNLASQLTSESLEPNQIINAINDIIDDSRDVVLRDFKLLEYPDSQNVNSFLSESLGDFRNIKESIIAIPSIITAEYNSTIAGIGLINTKAAQLQNSLNNLKLTTEKRGATKIYYSILNFTNPAQIDYSFPTSATYAHIDTTIGVVTLNKTSSESIDKATFQVLKSNKNEVRDINDDMPTNFFYEGRFYGRPEDVVPEGNDFHFSVLTNPTRLISQRATEAQITETRAKIFDNNFDTAWVCEYVQDNNNADTTPLRLDILIDLKKNYTISSLTIAPYQVNKGDFLDIIDIRAGINTVDLKPLRVFQNNIEDTNARADKPVASSAPENGEINNRINVIFNPVTARYIAIDLKQSNVVPISYPLLKVKAIRKNPLSNNVETASFILSYLETVALSSKYADNVKPEELLPAILNLSGDWTISPELESEIRSDKTHQAIGISEIKISNNLYSAVSEFVSSKQYFPQDINQVRLTVDEIIPDDFGAGDWTEYYVSFDSNTFYRIMPAGTGNTKAGVPSVIKPSGTYRELVIKAVLKRPANTTNLSPAIRNIKINVETK